VAAGGLGFSGAGDLGASRPAMREPPIDADLLEQTVRSLGFLAIDARYVSMRAGKARELEQPVDGEKTAFLRGFLRASTPAGGFRNSADEADPAKRRRVQRDEMAKKKRSELAERVESELSAIESARCRSWWARSCSVRRRGRWRSGG